MLVSSPASSLGSACTIHDRAERKRIDRRMPFSAALIDGACVRVRESASTDLRWMKRLLRLG